MIGFVKRVATAATLFAGQDLPGAARPIAQAYAGHQFGGFTMLGDGRAILLGEHRTPSGRLVDVQLKGAGPTRFSRRGDGLAALAPTILPLARAEGLHAHAPSVEIRLATSHQPPATSHRPSAIRH